MTIEDLIVTLRRLCHDMPDGMATQVRIKAGNGADDARWPIDWSVDEEANEIIMSPWMPARAGSGSPPSPSGGWIAPREISEIDGPAELVSPDGKCLGEIRSYLQFLDIRLRIMRAGAEGYKVRYRGRDIPVGSNGELADYPDGLFDKATLMLLGMI